MTSPIETNNVVERSFIDHLRSKAATTDDIGDATDFAQAADELQSLSDRIDVLEGVVREVVRIDGAYDVEMYIDEFDDSIADHHLWRQTMDDARASLTQGGKNNG